MNGKKWLKVFASILLLLESSVFSLNYIIDPFNIFHTKILKTEFQENERFIKIELLEKKKDKYNGYIFGSSRIGTTPPEYFEKYIDNSKFFNFTISTANLYDYEKHLEYFIKNKYPIKTLFLQIDLDNMNKYGRDESDYLRKLHPHVVNEKLFNYYMMYLFNFFPFNIKGKIYKNIYDASPTNFNLETGVWNKPLKDKQIKNNCNEFIKRVVSFNKKNKRRIKYTKRKQNLNSLKMIKELCIDNNIKLIVFVTPHNKNFMDGFIVDDYINFISDLASVLEFYNFSGYNTITTNNCNYYEYSHYRSNVGKLIAAKIFKDKKIAVPNDFGFFVSKRNIKKHIEYLRNNILEYEGL